LSQSNQNSSSSSGNSSSASQSSQSTGSSSSSSTNGFTTIKVLFVGNSFTYYNETFNILCGLDSNININIVYGLTLNAGQTLAYNWVNASGDGEPSASNQIYNGKFNYVIFQDYSSTAWVPSTCSNFVTNWAIIYNNAILSNGGIPIFYETWAYQPDLLSYISNSSSDDTQQLVAYMYTNTAKTLGSLCAPCGDAWLLYYQKYGPASNLYVTSESPVKHPTNYTSYMNACTLFATIFKKSPVGNPYTTVNTTESFPAGANYVPVTFSSNEAAIFQNLAWQAYTNHLTYIGGQ
jgi:hypothetical protein